MQLQPGPDTGAPRPNRLIVITGPTGSGKTALAIDLARRLGTEIISADSRQLYRDIPIGTAAPTPEQLAAVPHHFVGTLPLDAYYSAAEFEADVIKLLPDIFARCGGTAVMCGGSMMYIDAVCRGIDELPTISEEVRERCRSLWLEEGTAGIIARLEKIDPEYLKIVDLQNHRRLVHALEISLEAGVPYSSLRTGQPKPRPFEILKFAVELPREELFNRINSRVTAMVDAGLLDEARRVYPLRHLNSLNTVGYKELFAHFDGLMDLPTALDRIRKNTRVYAKKQLTWLKKDPTLLPLSALSQL